MNNLLFLLWLYSQTEISVTSIYIYIYIYTHTVIQTVFINSPKLETTRVFIHSTSGYAHCGIFIQWNTAQQEQTVKPR